MAALDGSIGMVRDFDRCPEDRHHRIAYVLIDDSASCLDGTGYFGKIGIKLLDQLLRQLRLTVRSEVP